MKRLAGVTHRTFESLAVLNYRLFFVGQAISLSGTWMQRIAQGLLVLQLTHSGSHLGFVTALQTLPVLFFGAWGGVVADRVSKRSLLYGTQRVAGLTSLMMGGLVLTGEIRLWMVYVLAVVYGTNRVVDNPTRQTFIREMVGDEHLTNAISLNSVETNLTRLIGASLAGALAATIGLAACFLADGVSYFLVVAMLARMRGRDLHPAPRTPRVRGQVGEGLRYVRSEPVIRSTLLMMAIIGTFTYEFGVSLPLFAEFTFGRGTTGYAALSAALGAGAVIGGLYTAGRQKGNARSVTISAMLFGFSVLVASLAPSLAFACVAMVVVGFFSINFTSLGNSTVQMHAAAGMQGRVMSLWTVAFLGSTPIGGPIVGVIGEHAGARWALVLGGVAALLAALIGMLTIHQQRRKEAADRQRAGAYRC